MLEDLRIWALVCLSSESVEYSCQDYRKVQTMFKLVPEDLRSNFAVMRFDVNRLHVEPYSNQAETREV